MSRYGAQASAIWVVSGNTSVCPQCPEASLLDQGVSYVHSQEKPGRCLQEQGCFALQPECAPLTKTCIDKEAPRQPPQL